MKKGLSLLLALALAVLALPALAEGTKTVRRAQLGGLCG